MDRLQGQESPLHAIHHGLPAALLHFLPTRSRERRLATLLSLSHSFSLSFRFSLSLSLSQSLPAPHSCFKNKSKSQPLHYKTHIHPLHGKNHEVLRPTLVSFTHSGQVAPLSLTILRRTQPRDFPGGPVAKTPRSQCRGPGFDPWSGN